MITGAGNIGIEHIADHTCAVECTRRWNSGQIHRIVGQTKYRVAENKCYCRNRSNRYQSEVLIAAAIVIVTCYSKHIAVGDHKRNIVGDTVVPDIRCCSTRRCQRYRITLTDSQRNTCINNRRRLQLHMNGVVIPTSGEHINAGYNVYVACQRLERHAVYNIVVPVVLIGGTASCERNGAAFTDIHIIAGIHKRKFMNSQIQHINTVASVCSEVICLKCTIVIIDSVVPRVRFTAAYGVIFGKLIYRIYLESNGV